MPRSSTRADEREAVASAVLAPLGLSIDPL